MSGPVLPIDDGLRHRFLEAAERIAWRPAPRSGGRRRTPGARIAHLHDEEARVEEQTAGGVERVVVDSGPVGALVLLVEIDRRGAPTAVEARPAGGAGFPQGALEVRWGGPPPDGPSLPLRDLVELARYALA